MVKAGQRLAIELAVEKGKFSAAFILVLLVFGFPIEVAQNVVRPLKQTVYSAAPSRMSATFRPHAVFRSAD
jgi:hypothetical protein